MPRAKRWESYFRTAPLQSGDGQDGTWSRKRLLQMDKRFTARMQRAIERGESRGSREGPDALKTPTASARVVQTRRGRFAESVPATMEGGAAILSPRAPIDNHDEI